MRARSYIPLACIHQLTAHRQWQEHYHHRALSTAHRARVGETVSRFTASRSCPRLHDEILAMKFAHVH